MCFDWYAEVKSGAEKEVRNKNAIYWSKKKKKKNPSSNAELKDTAHIYTYFISDLLCVGHAADTVV